MAGIPGWVYTLLGQSVTVEPYTGVGSTGVETYGAGFAVTAIVEESDELARGTAPEDDRRTVATLRCALGTNCPAGSRITLASGRRGYAAAVKHWDGQASPAPSHLEVTLSALSSA